MKIFLRYFWILFIFYFIFIHPAIIYYAGVGMGDYQPNLTFFYLSVVLWILIILFLAYYLYQISFQKKQRIQDILSSGRRLEGRIISSKITSIQTNHWEMRELLISMENLKGERIQHEMMVTDSKPHERRFEEGNRIYFRIDPNLKANPVMVMEGSQTTINTSIFLIWGVFLCGIIGYYFTVFQYEGNGERWNFVGPWHPLLISAYSMIAFSLIFYFLMGKFLKGFFGKNYSELKYNGRKTLAKITKVSETGTRINNQPLIRFDIEYTDQFGKVYQTEIKKSFHYWIWQMHKQVKK
jgi:hypothetical protein